MKVACFLLMLTGAAVAGESATATATAEGEFRRRLPDSDKTEQIVSAFFDDRVCFHVTGTAKDGEHVTETVVYDGNGREVARTTGPIKARRGRWGKTFCYGFESTDAPGEWWYVTSLDGEILASESLTVTRGRRP